MITRIVKMTFRISAVEEFKEIYRENWTKIRAFEGCRHVELLQDVDTPNVFFTYSKWDSVEHLDNYRKSEVFSGIWKRTKPLFSDKPLAWSSNQVL